MDSVTTHGLTFRWADDHLVITTPKGQYSLDAQGTALLLDLLYAQKDEIFDAEAHTDGLAAWARQHPGQQFVIGSLNPQPEPQHHSRFRSTKAAHVGDEMRMRMDNTRDWTPIHEQLEHLLPHGLDAATWEVLRQQPLPFVADELLWRVEAIARQVPAQGPLFVHPIFALVPSIQRYVDCVPSRLEMESGSVVCCVSLLCVSCLDFRCCSMMQEESRLMNPSPISVLNPSSRTCLRCKERLWRTRLPIHSPLLLHSVPVLVRCMRGEKAA